jgi:hypothetical protein
MAKVTLKQIFEANQGLHKLVSLDTDFELARGLAKLVQAFDTDATLIDKKRKEIFDKYAETDKEGKRFVDGAKFETFQADLEVFFATEVDLTFQPINEALLEDIKLSANEYRILMPFLTVEPNKKKKK